MLQPAPDLYLGQMSGTSLDGVDTVLTAPGLAPADMLLDSSCTPFPHELTRRLQHAARSVQWNVSELLSLRTDYTAFCAAAATDLLNAHNHLSLVAAGCHGQTIRHQIEPEVSTFQLIDGALLAEALSVDVVCDFRSRDVAAGGQGAPLLPAFLKAAFTRELERGYCILNLGGIANICFLDASGELRGFDTGPASTLLDAAAEQYFDIPFDDGGSLAAGGHVDEQLLQRLMEEPYFHRPSPKSTGPELFSWNWLMELACQDLPAAGDKINGRHMLTTLTELTARSVAEQIARACTDCTGVIVYGGGARNYYLIERIRKVLNSANTRRIEIVDSGSRGLDSNMLEAVAFSWLASQFVSRTPVDCHTVTGARGPRILGCLYPGK